MENKTLGGCKNSIGESKRFFYSLAIIKRFALELEGILVSISLALLCSGPHQVSDTEISVSSSSSLLLLLCFLLQRKKMKIWQFSYIRGVKQVNVK